MTPREIYQAAHDAFLRSKFTSTDERDRTATAWNLATEAHDVGLQAVWDEAFNEGHGVGANSIQTI